jgi:predicted O-methyltransferase YrrM
MSNVEKKIDLESVVGLYEKYADDLKKVRAYQKGLYRKYLIQTSDYFPYYLIRFFSKLFGLISANAPSLHPQSDDIEAEITYLLLRENKPEVVVEISPCGGWSTAWILHALKDNGKGKLYSYDLVDDSTKNVPKELSDGRWVFVQGDVKKKINELPRKIDYLFLDSDHSTSFGQWIVQSLLPKLSSGVPVSVHDVYHSTNTADSGGEGTVVVDWLQKKSISFFTASKAKEKGNFDAISAAKQRLGLGSLVHVRKNNPTIYFIYRS